MEKLREGIREYSDELLNKVQWPTLEELQSSTVTVLIASMVLALVIFGMDFAFRNTMNALYSLINL